MDKKMAIQDDGLIVVSVLLALVILTVLGFSMAG
jgi:Tfp pilus assembly protein PilX